MRLALQRRRRHPPAFVIAGMHRSGTSMTARVLNDFGVSVGDRLLQADRYNVRGYYEDLDFLALGMRMAAACCDPAEAGHHDWGVTESGHLDRGPLSGFRDEAAALVEARRTAGVPWGFKDPRATLFLDFWRELIPEATFVLVFRPPWDVIASTRRIEGGPFIERPALAATAWRVYNRELIEFARSFPERCVVIPAAAFVDGPVARKLAARFRDRLGGLEFDPRRMARAVDRELLSSADEDAPEVALARRLLPDGDEVLAELAALAG